MDCFANIRDGFQDPRPIFLHRYAIWCYFRFIARVLRKLWTLIQNLQAEWLDFEPCAPPASAARGAVSPETLRPWWRFIAINGSEHKLGGSTNKQDQTKIGRSTRHMDIGTKLVEASPFFTTPRFDQTTWASLRFIMAYWTKIGQRQ